MFLIPHETLPHRKFSSLQPLWSESDTSCNKDETHEGAIHVLPAETDRQTKTQTSAWFNQ